MNFCTYSKLLTIYANYCTVKPVYNEQVSLKASFYYNRSIYKEIYAFGANDMLRYKRQFVITESAINRFNRI